GQRAAAAPQPRPAARLKLAGALVSAVALAAVALCLVSPRAQAQRPSEKAAATPAAPTAQGREGTAAKPQPPAKLTIAGRVLDAAGRPVAEARVAVVHDRASSASPAAVRVKVLAPTQTDQQGHYPLDVSVPKSVPRDDRRALEEAHDRTVSLLREGTDLTLLAAEGLLQAQGRQPAERLQVLAAAAGHGLDARDLARNVARQTVDLHLP